jgi:hypothetical protein
MKPNYFQRVRYAAGYNYRNGVYKLDILALLAAFLKGAGVLLLVPFGLFVYALYWPCDVLYRCVLRALWVAYAQADLLGAHMTGKAWHVRQFRGEDSRIYKAGLAPHHAHQIAEKLDKGERGKPDSERSKFLAEPMA